MTLKRQNNVQGRIVGFEKGPKNLDLVSIDIGRKSDCFIDLSEFVATPKVGETYDFVIVRELSDGTCVISRSLAEKRKFINYIDGLVRDRTVVDGKILKPVQNGYIISIENVNIPVFLFSSKTLEVNSIVPVIITNNLGTKLRCQIKGDETIALQPGDIIRGTVSACNDFFYVIKSDAIPDSDRFEANVYRADCHTQLDVGNSGEFCVLYCDKTNIFLSFKEQKSNDIEVGKIYDGVVKDIRFGGIVVTVNQVKVQVKINEVSWALSVKLDKMFKIDQKIKVCIISYDEESGDIYGSIRRNGETTDYFQDFIKKKKIGDIVKVLVRSVKVKDDNKITSKVVLVSEENSEFIMVLHVGDGIDIQQGSFINVKIESIKPDIYKVGIVLSRPSYRDKRFSDAELCTVTKIAGRYAFGQIKDNVEGKIYGNVDQLQVGDKILCKVKYNRTEMILIPLNYSMASDTVANSTMGSLFDDIDGAENE